MASIKKRFNKAGEVSYSITVFMFTDVNGKQVIKGMTWKPPAGMKESAADKQAQKEATLFEDKVKNGIITVDGSMKFSDYAARWLENAEFRPNSRKGEEIRINNINQAIGHIPLEKLRPEHLQQFYKNLREEGTRQRVCNAFSENLKSRMSDAGIRYIDLVRTKACGSTTIGNAMRGKPISRENAERITKALSDMGMNTKKLFVYDGVMSPLSPTTVKTYHATIRQILMAAKKSRILPHSITEYMDAPRGEVPEARYMDEKQAREYLAALLNEPDIRIRTAFLILLFTGMRRSELCGLEWQDIDFSENVIQVRRGSHYVAGVGIYDSAPKTRGSARSIAAAPFLMQVLRQYSGWQAEYAESLGDAWKNEKQRLFTAQDGGLINPIMINEWARYFHKKSGIPYMNPHALRHTFATLQLTRGIDWRTVASMTGHSNPATLLNTYSHAVKSAQDKAAATIENTLLLPDGKDNTLE